jgi:hypothetical protein
MDGQLNLKLEKLQLFSFTCLLEVFFPFVVFVGLSDGLCSDFLSSELRLRNYAKTLVSSFKFLNRTNFIICNSKHSQFILK